ncbi:probable RNA-dependent RNA polymerase 1 [Nephila pilipes]|uniref:RNA-dependent RNA polymerase n=1 Tax=Nephila pilipes TaxID=299642 RepID=A0A8X6UK24_NEPPI|nr:probable RNA-dependent RNA polymerase 1 [Nephila pilipes]
MAQLNFRIIIIPKPNVEPNLNILKCYIGQCGLVLRNLKRVELEKTKHPTFEQILECIFDVEARIVSTVPNNDKVNLYKNLIVNWNKATKAVGERPMLQLSHDECFVRKRVSCHSKLRLQNISFGVQARLGEYIAYSTICENSTACFFHDMKELKINATIIVNHSFSKIIETQKSLIISYTNIRNIIVSFDSEVFELYLDLQHPPLFYEEIIEHNVSSPQIRRIYHRVLPFETQCSVVGKSPVLRLNFIHIDYAFNILSCLRNRSGKIPIQFIAMSVKFKPTPTISPINFTHFGCTYMWAAIMNRTFLIQEQCLDITRSQNKLLRYSEMNGDCLEKVLSDIVFLIDSGRFLNYWNVIDKLYSCHLSLRQNDSFQNMTIPEKCRLIRRIVITPTRMMMFPPDLMCENRILRNFDSEFFLRVTFKDDDFLPLNLRMYKNSVFVEVVNKPVNFGIIIGKRHYKILAWSSSQLREHGISMYAKDSKGNTASDIRKWTEIDPRTTMNIPKCLARIGQCFSQTEETLHVPLNDLHVRFEKDIECGLNPATMKPYTFSDGIGRISKDLVKKVSKTLRRGHDSSAFQIRYGGCKGMLVLDPTLKGVDIVFRESMQKFHCRGYGHTKLEIVKKSSPIPLRLNRPFIAILHDMGVDPRIFLRMQEIMLQNIIDMLLEEEKAARYLNFRTPFSVFKFKDLSRSGINLTTEPFFRTLLLSLQRYYIDVIKTKANVEIDPAYGRNMFGVLDETGILQYGQVFVQYSSDVTFGVTTPNDTKILTGIVMVTKFPCVHPGDVRKFLAIDVPELHHIIDCIVFPQKGPRPHPDEMAGSDLDGDEYSVIWMPELIFNRQNEIPAHYPKPDLQIFQNITDFLLNSDTTEIANFLVEYIKNDKIGSIATAHLAFSDQLSVHHKMCVNIAKKHALAVDFAKTGVSVRLVREENPNKFPDFMEKFWKKKYRSKKSLGKMYRVSRDFETDNQAYILKYHDVEIDPALVVEGWQKYELSATNSKNQYNNSLKTILLTYGISHETEAFGGSFIKLHARFNERRDRADIVNLVQTWIKELVEKTRKEFFKDMVAASDANHIVDDIKKKASAWYIVTYREKDPEFLSFPWILSEILANIKILWLKMGKVNSTIPLALKFEKQIIDNARAGMLPSLNSDASFVLNSLYFLCDRTIVERAISVLTKWADEEKLISSTYREGNFLYYKTFLKLIIYVAESENYVSRKPGQPRKERPTTAALCISFLKYCMKLRFLSKEEVLNILPFQVYKDRILARIASIAFHTIVVTGNFSSLCNQEFLDDPPELVDMKVVSIDTSVFGSSPIEESKLRNAESALLNYSEAEHVSIRENCQRKKVIVDARGTPPSVRRLKYLLFKKHDVLVAFFSTGTLP